MPRISTSYLYSERGAKMSPDPDPHPAQFICQRIGFPAALFVIKRADICHIYREISFSAHSATVR